MSEAEVDVDVDIDIQIDIQIDIEIAFEVCNSRPFRASRYARQSREVCGTLEIVKVLDLLEWLESLVLPQVVMPSDIEAFKDVLLTQIAQSLRASRVFKPLMFKLLEFHEILSIKPSRLLRYSCSQAPRSVHAVGRQIHASTSDEI